MTQTEKIILKDLYESVNGLYAFTFYARYKIEPDDIFLFITKYTSRNIVVYEDDRLSLSEEGRTIILKQLFIKTVGTKGRFSNIPPAFLKDKIKVNSPYLPDYNKLSAEITNSNGGGIETSIKEV